MIHRLDHEPDRWRADGRLVRDRNGCAVMLCESQAEARRRVLIHNALATKYRLATLSEAV